ncbi:hypothetical protein HK104_002377 [Borealophlyctis nickersoniae]|nr:hypothetical protein HK104_002377 [Borealophlyctis nickersoniae]
MYNLYWEAFEKFRAVPPIQSLQDNHEFCELVQSMLDTHMVAIPQLAMGIAESSAHMRLRDADRFMNEMLRSRIGRRVLAEQHIALSAVFDGKRAQEDGWIGIVNTRCVAEDIVKRCADMAARLFRDTYGIEPPQVLVDGQLEATFKYIPDHIEYIIFELLKNSMHATIATHAPDVLSRAESGDALELDAAKPGVASETKADQRVPADPMTSTSSPSPPPSSSSTSASSPSPPSHNDQPPTAPPTPTTLPPIRVTIGESESTIMFRVSDQGGGIESSIQEHIWSYAHPSKRKFANFAQVPRLAAKVEESVSPTLKLGLGLPMSKVYADYWGGNVSMYTMFGYGTDVYVAISVGNQVENLKYE